MMEFFFSEDKDLPWSVRIFRWVFMVDVILYSILMVVEKWIEVFS